jgi:hypothetical protein
MPAKDFNKGHDFSIKSIFQSPVYPSTKISISTYNYWGARWRSWLRHYATNRQVEGSIPDGVTGIFQ